VTLAYVFIRHSVRVDQPAHSCRRELLEAPERWLPPPCVARGGRRYRTRVGLGAHAARVTRAVDLTVGECAAEGDRLVVPVAWRAAAARRLFPVLDAKLTVRPLGPHSATLELDGVYRPPLGGLGREIDHAALHGVAEATTRDFLERVAASLAELASRRPA
jgi:hypothetical protein